MDMGCGGGFPGIPLAIMFPDVEFHLVDSIGKKVRVAGEIAQAIGLTNVRTSHSRAEEIKEKYSFVVSRAVMQLPDLVKICRKNISGEQFNALPNGIICLKGGDMTAETQQFRNCREIVDISTYFSEEFFKDKKVVYVQL
jgi:16S rRNA (guanine527-N7)-methyltransferase